jgi:hypothetical protein
MTIPFSIFWLNIGLTANMLINQGINSKFGEFIAMVCGFQTKLSKKIHQTFKKIRNFGVLDRSFWQSHFNHVIQVTTGKSEKRWDLPTALTKGSNECRQLKIVRKVFAKVRLD